MRIRSHLTIYKWHVTANVDGMPTSFNPAMIFFSFGNMLLFMSVIDYTELN